MLCSHTCVTHLLVVVEAVEVLEPAQPHAVDEHLRQLGRLGVLARGVAEPADLSGVPAEGANGWRGRKSEWEGACECQWRGVEVLLVDETRLYTVWVLLPDMEGVLRVDEETSKLCRCAFLIRKAYCGLTKTSRTSKVSM